jgi:hypothetical protein
MPLTDILNTWCLHAITFAMVVTNSSYKLQYQFCMQAGRYQRQPQNKYPCAKTVFVLSIFAHSNMRTPAAA